MLKKGAVVEAGLRDVGVEGRVKVDTNMQEDVGIHCESTRKKQMRAQAVTGL